MGQLSEGLTSSYALYFMRRAGQMGPGVGQIEAQWATEPQADPTVGHIFWGYPDAWPPPHWEEFKNAQDGWILNTGWNSYDGRDFYELRTLQETLTIDGSMFDVTLPGGPQRYALSVVPRGDYRLVTHGEMWVRGGDKIGDYMHVQNWGAPRPVENPLWWEGPLTKPALVLTEEWHDSGGAESQQECAYAFGLGVGWKVVSTAAGTRHMLSGWAY